MPWVAIVERQRSGCGRDQNKVCEHVVASVREIAVDAATFVAQNPTHPWSDPLFKEFIVDITDQQAADIRSNATPLFHGRRVNLPRWQQATDGSGSTFSPGSFVDPEDHNSTFNAGTPLGDDRWIVRLYDGDPGSGGTHLAAKDYDEGEDAGEATVFLKLFTEADVPSTTNVQNAKTLIGGTQFVFDFTAGVTSFGVKTDKAGTATFPSSATYRVIGPSGENSAQFRVYGRSISVR